MLGTIVNTIAILAGAFLGMLLKGGFPESWSRSLFKAVGLAVILVGLKGALETDRLLLVIISIASGTLLGEAMDIEGRLNSLGKWLETRVAFGNGDFSKGFVTASLIFCVGAMAVVGAFESGLTGNHQILYAKSAMDGITGLILASTLGTGVLFAGFSVLVYQGLLTLAAASLKVVMVPEVTAQMSAVGGLLIAGIGFNMLGVEKIKVGNFLPAIFVPVAWFHFVRLFSL